MKCCWLTIKKPLFVLLWVAAYPFTSLGQSLDEPAARLRFRDSLKQALQSTYAADPVIATQFDSLWGRLTLSQRTKIKTQSHKMRTKQYLTQTNIAHYYASVIYTISKDIAMLDSYLEVVEQAIDKQDKSVLGNLFAGVYRLLKQDALHTDKGFRLLALDAIYKFDYIDDTAPAPPEQRNDEGDEPLYEDDDWEDQPVSEGGEEIVDRDETAVVSEEPPWLRMYAPPELTGPVLRFDRVTLGLMTSYDSVFLKSTNGVLSFTNNAFVGKGGVFDWSSVGLSEDSVYFEFEQYHFDITKPAIKEAYGHLTYTSKLPYKTAGVFEFISKKHSKSKKSLYPRFISFASDIQWPSIQSDSLKYTGGFALDGATVRSRSVQNDYAKLEIMAKGGIHILAQARVFRFKDSVISSQDASISIYHGRDSIHQPSAFLWYDRSTHKLTLRRGRKGTRNAVYSTPYFSVDFTADKLQWDIHTDSLSITAAGSRGQNPMILESVNFYDPEYFRILTGYGFNFHPVALVVDYALHKNVRQFYISEIAQNTGQKFRDVHRAMLFLVQKGMVEYDTYTGLISVKDKAINIFKARKGDIDYDNIKIHSVTDGEANAVLSLHDKQMHIKGVDNFNISDSLKVAIAPQNHVITLLKDRSLQFDGKITAGNFEIYGKDFTFRYDSFLIYLNHIDSIQLYVIETDDRGQKIRSKLGNTVEGIDSTNAATEASHKTSGTLYISRPNNKSGRKKMPNYPRLDAETGGIIYFDKKEILNKAYDRTIFYVLPPFKLDSLNDADPAAIRFDGKFISGGIFPPFEQAIYTRPDKSLGFKHRIPEPGYSMFEGEGTVTGSIDLSNAGIRVSGEINHLSAHLKSDDFVCYTDSVVGMGYVGELHQKQIGKVEYPGVSLPAFKLKWIPRRDWFELNNVDDPFALYQSSAKLDGRILLSKKGIFGKGTLSAHGFDARSDDFIFNVDHFEAQHTDFNLTTAVPNKPAIAGKDIRLQFNLQERYADLHPEIAGDAALEFPYAQFKTSIPKARWDLNTKKVTMEKEPSMPLEDSYFYTTRPDLDSLNFMGKAAEYDVERQTLKVMGIPYIKVSDAKIIPQDNKIIILENARIGTLKNADVILDTLNEYHHLIDGTITILSRKKFSGRATYQHVNVDNDTFAIKMTDFRVEPIDINRENIGNRKKNQLVAMEETVASGVVTAADSLILFSNIFYKGNITMYATRPSLQLKGSIKLGLHNIKDYNTWIDYEQSGNEAEMFLDFNNAETETGKRPNAGLHFADDNSLYITFTFDKKSPDDKDFFFPRGSLFYNKDSKQFHIENRARALGDQFSGTAFTYNEDRQEVKFSGPVYFFGKDVVQRNFSLVATALGSGNLKTNDIQMNAFLMLDPYIPLQALSSMASDLKAVVEEQGLEEGFIGDQTELLYKISDIVGENAVEKFEDQSGQTYTPLTTIPQLLKPIVFANVPIKRSTAHRAFYSTGRLGLSNILNQDVNGSLEGFLEIKMNEDGSPVVHLFFRAAPYSWYYFGLEDDRLLIYSSNDIFNAIIAKKTTAGKGNKGGVTFAQGSNEEVLDFINRFRKDYYDIDTPFQLDMPLQQSDQEDQEDSEDDGF